MEQINLNIIPDGLTPVVHASQYDDGREFKVNLFEGKTPYSLSGTEIIEFDVKKPDGTITTTNIPNEGGTSIIVSTNDQSCTAPGECKCKLKITSNGVTIGSRTILMIVEESPLNHGLDSASDIYNLRRQIQEVIIDLTKDLEGDTLTTFSGGLDAIDLDFQIESR